MNRMCASYYKCLAGSTAMMTVIQTLSKLGVKERMARLQSYGWCDCPANAGRVSLIRRVQSSLYFRVNADGAHTRGTSCREHLVSDYLGDFRGDFYLRILMDTETIRSLNRCMQTYSLDNILSAIDSYTDKFVTPLLLPYGLSSKIKVSLPESEKLHENVLFALKFSEIPKGLIKKPWILHLFTGLMRDAVSLAIWDPSHYLGNLKTPKENNTDALIRYYFNRLIPEYQRVYPDSDGCVFSKCSLSSEYYEPDEYNEEEEGFNGEEKLRELLTGKVNMKRIAEADWFSRPSYYL